MIDIDKLPPISAVYRVLHQGRVVYVGQATNLKKRWKCHHLYPVLYKKFGANWTIKWVAVSPGNLNRAEAFAYRFFKPELNQSDPNRLIESSAKDTSSSKYIFEKNR